MKIIKNGKVVDPANNLEQELDILIDEGRIKATEKPGSFSNLDKSNFSDNDIIDARGLIVAPGFIDMHVHLREPGFEWKETIESGSQAALAGGYTSVCCMPNTKPVNDNAEITKFILDKAKNNKLCNVLPIGSVTLALKGAEMSPLSELRDAGCVAFSDDGEPVFNSGIMRRALEWANMLDAVICRHEEDKHLSCGGAMNESALSSRLGLKGFPKVAEEVMIARDIELARATDARIHICHVSTARSVELIRRAKNDGIKVTAEATPHHIFLTEDAVKDFDTNAKMSPPLRDLEDCQAIIQGLIDGSIDVIASDHAPHEADTKEIEFSKAAYGILGLQTSLPLIFSLVENQTISLLKAIEILSYSSAKILNLNKGRDSIGNLSKDSKADIVLIDPGFNWSFGKDSIKSLSFNTPFIGREMTGVAHTVLVAGELLVKDKILRQENL